MIIDDIKGRINIIELAKNEGLQLKGQSKRIYKTTCCFHNEKNASLTFYADTNTFNCFACQAHGDAINFYAKRHNLGIKEAVRELAGQLGLQTPARGLHGANYTLKTHATRLPDDARGAFIVKGTQRGIKTIKEALKGKEKQFKIHPDAIYQALKDFSGELDQESQTYLTSQGRGLTDETIKHFQLFSIKDYKKTKDFLLKRFKLETLQDLVLINRKQNRFLFIKHKIIIPVIEDGKIVAIRGRYFDKGFSDPAIFKNTFSFGKYNSTAGVANRLFNGDILKTLKKGERVYLCEGEFDTMILHQHGKHAVGVLGVSNYNDETIKRLNDFDLVIAFDNDTQGRKEALKISNLFYKQTGREVIREKLPEGIKDITELFIYKAKQNENIQS
jgi:DNA primase